MSYDNNDVEYESGAPKKADVLIKSTQTIVSKQEELAEQTKLAISRIDEAIELCHKNSEEASYILEHSTEMFDKLQAENSSLKQELLYLAKQSENIYAGLAEKLSEMEQESRQQSGEAEFDENYYELADRLAEIYDQIGEISARVDALAVQKTEDSLNDKFAILYDKIDAVAVEAARPVGGGLSASESRAILDKLDQLADSMRKNESAHSMLADRFEILSMRVEQFGYGSAKTQPAYSQPVASYPAPVQPAQTAEIDYDKLAAKVAELLSVRDAVSPDYIASKVAEQIVLPEQTGADIDTQELAKEVAALIDVKEPLQLDEEAIVTKISDRVSELVAEAKIEPVDEDALADKLAERLGTAAVDVNEETLAERIAEKLNIADSVVAPVDIDEEALAERLAEKLNVVSEQEDTEETEEAEETEAAPVFDEDALVDKIVERLGALNTETNIDQEDLADAIALKVGSIKPEDFEILVDDAGCASISKEIAEKLDYEFISSLVADKLREILDINAANAPDYEDMAERISEKITVAGINEDAIADKAAAVLSNYLPEFDVEEIADKVTGAVIDVVAAMPQPTVDSEAICNEITERLIEKQEDNNYDIVIDDDGISRITAIVTEEIEKDTDERFNKLEESLSKINELVSNIVVEAEEEEPEEVEEEVTEEEYQTISDLVNTLSAHIETVEGKIDTLTELIGEPEEVEETEEEYSEGEEEYAEELDEDEYAKLSEIVAARFDSVEGKIDSLTELITGTEEVEEYDEVTEEDFKALSEIVAAEIEKGVSSRLDSVEEDIRKIHSLVGGLAVADATGEAVADVHFYEQLDKLSEDIKKIAEYVEGDVPVVSNERLDKIAEDVAKISQLVDGELSVETAARLDKLQEEVEQILALLGAGTDREGGALKGIIIGGVAAPADETAASVAEAEEEEELIKVSDLVKPIPVAGDEEEDDDDGDFLLSALDMDSFSEDERMPGEIGDFEGVDFENMMKYNRSFIARIIQSEDDTKQYYGAVKQALLSYRKVNSNVAWGNERFNKGRETIARMKIRGKTLVIYLALDPNEYKTSVYHHADVSDNKSVLGTPMMIKVKSPLGVRKAIRLIDEMLAKRGGEKREVPERDYAAMYPYETIEELIEDGLVKDVRKK